MLTPFTSRSLSSTSALSAMKETSFGCIVSPSILRSASTASAVLAVTVSVFSSMLTPSTSRSLSSTSALSAMKETAFGCMVSPSILRSASTASAVFAVTVSIFSSISIPPTASRISASLVSTSLLSAVNTILSGCFASKLNVATCPSFHFPFRMSIFVVVTSICF